MSFLYNMMVKIRGSKMTYSNHRILHHLRRIIVLSRIHGEIRPSFLPYSSSRTCREPISMPLLTLNEPITGIKSVTVNWEESEVSGVTSPTYGPSLKKICGS